MALGGGDYLPNAAPATAGEARTYWGPARVVPSRRVRFGCVGLVLLVILVFAALFAFLFLQMGQLLSTPTQRIAAEVSTRSAGQIFNTMYVPGVPGGRPGFFFYVGPDASNADGVRLACTVVRPVLSQEGYGSSSFEIQRHGSGALDIGDVIASDSTACH
jgi:hypothetical protein